MYDRIVLRTYSFRNGGSREFALERWLAQKGFELIG